jgi:manganese transport protein
MQGLIHRSIPLLVRRSITLVPSLVVLGLGVNASAALVFSQVMLSFGVPFALVPLLLLCHDPSRMGGSVNRLITSRAAAAVATLIVFLNPFLLYRTFAGGWPRAHAHQPARPAQDSETLSRHIAAIARS